METVLSAKEYIPGLVFYLTAMEKRVELYKVDGECDDGQWFMCSIIDNGTVFMQSTVIFFILSN